MSDVQRLVMRMQCTNVEPTKYQDSIRLDAVYSDNPEDPNYSWSQATPFGNLTATISNPTARGFFTQGKKYLISIQEAE